MMTLLPIYQANRSRPKRRETERELLLRVAREHELERRRVRRRSVISRITGRNDRHAA